MKHFINSDTKKVIYKEKMWRSSYAICNFPCINVHKTSDDGSSLEPKHLAVNKLIKLVLCVMKHMYL